MNQLSYLHKSELQPSLEMLAFAKQEIAVPSFLSPLEFCLAAAVRLTRRDSGGHHIASTRISDLLTPNDTSL